MLLSEIKNNPTIYISHPIRGTSGDIEKNCRKAAAAARRLRKIFPEVKFYCPAESDLTLQILTADKRLSVDDVMYADLQVLSACHGWMFYHFDESAGSEIEREHAESLGIGGKAIKDGPEYKVDFVYDIEKASNSIIRKDFNDLIEHTIKRFKKG